MWNIDAFPSLVLPTHHKDLILAFVHSQITHNDSFDDVIEGKGINKILCQFHQHHSDSLIGQGVVILLSGEPGVGKTLTAESGMGLLSPSLYLQTI